MPAIEADVSVDRIPQNNADKATRETSPVRLGANWDSTPICTPNEPRFPKPIMKMLEEDNQYHRHILWDLANDVVSLLTGVLTTKSVRCNDLRAWSHGNILRLRFKSFKSNIFVGDDLEPNEFSGVPQICAGYANEESNRITDIPHQQLQGQVWLAVLRDVDIASDNQQDKS